MDDGNKNSDTDEDYDDSARSAPTKSTISQAAKPPPGNRKKNAGSKSTKSKETDFMAAGDTQKPVASKGTRGRGRGRSNSNVGSGDSRTTVTMVDFLPTALVSDFFTFNLL